jgi:hypothetical protein
MTIRNLFECMNTDVPRVIIYDYEDNVIWQKHSGIPVGKLPLLEKKCSLDISS